MSTSQTSTSSTSSYAYELSPLSSSPSPPASDGSRPVPGRTALKMQRSVSSHPLSRTTSSALTPPYTPCKHLEDQEEATLVGGTDQRQPPSRALNVDDRAQMDELMSLPSTRKHCDMAAEVINLIVPGQYASSTLTVVQKIRASEEHIRRLSRAIERWASISPHPLCTLITSVIYLERLSALHPGIFKEATSPDTPSRLAFAAMILALKFTCDVSHVNGSLARFTSWTVEDVNLMETQLLEGLDWNVWISSKDGAEGFWSIFSLAIHVRRASAPAPLNSQTSSASISAPGNLFLMLPRAGVHEKHWRGGLVRSPGEAGSRIERGEPDETVWRAGRLQRAASYPPSSRRRLSKTVAPILPEVLLEGGEAVEASHKTLRRRDSL